MNVRFYTSSHDSALSIIDQNGSIVVDVHNLFYRGQRHQLGLLGWGKSAGFSLIPLSLFTLQKSVRLAVGSSSIMTVLTVAICLIDNHVRLRQLSWNLHLVKETDTNNRLIDGLISA